MAAAARRRNLKLTDIRGLKYPDEYLIRFFFKAGLHHRTGHVVEAGAGNGNNLMLFSAYGWRVTGIDILEAATADARANFAHDERARFVTHDLASGVPEELTEAIDCLSLANVVNYLPRQSYSSLLSEFVDRLADDAWVFVRTRTPADYRYGRGEPAGRNAFVLDTKETGEEGLLNVFYEQHEVVSHLTDRLGVDPDTLVTLHVDHQNVQNGMIISNSDLVVWGRRS